jgi:hypothetical protein
MFKLRGTQHGCGYTCDLCYSADRDRRISRPARSKFVRPYLKNKTKVKRLGCGSSGRALSPALPKNKSRGDQSTSTLALSCVPHRFLLSCAPASLPLVTPWLKMAAGLPVIKLTFQLADGRKQKNAFPREITHSPSAYIPSHNPELCHMTTQLQGRLERWSFSRLSVPSVFEWTRVLS